MIAKDHAKGKPTITHYFASRRIPLGDVWQIYLNAIDEDGDMKYILGEVYQPGIGNYPLSFLKIPHDQQRDLSGYIYLSTAGIHNLNFLNLSLKLTIQDKIGQHSDSISFTLAFEPKAKPENPPAGIFQERELGPIMIKLTPEGSTPGP